jgi:hypothetical protein
VIKCRGLVIKCTSAQDKEQVHLHSACKKRTDRSCDRAHTTYDRALVHEILVSCSPILVCFILLGFCRVLVVQGLNRTIFRVSRFP